MADDDGIDGASSSEALAEFRSLVEAADRKFARVRDLPPSARGPLHLLHFRKSFKAYTLLWHFQQQRRRELVAGGLQRWEIGDVASRIGQLYYGQYQRTSEVRFLFEAYVFYEAIVSRGYFETARAPATAPDLRLRYKELRFLVRFLIVALLLNRNDEVRQLADRFRALVEESKAAFPAMNFKEWKQVTQEISRFSKADASSKTARPLRYNVLFDAHPTSFPYVARFHSTRVLRLQDAILTCYHRNEVKVAELTLDTFRILQCLEWEPSGSSYQPPIKEPCQNGASSDQSGASGLIDINLAADMMDPDLPPNPRKAVIYRPSVSHLIAVIATISEDLNPDSILLIYLSASGKPDFNVPIQKDIYGKSRSSKGNYAPHSSWERDSSLSQPASANKTNSTDNLRHYICLGSQGAGSSNNLYPEDLVPFTRKPLFLIIDSDNSQAFKIVHGAERGEASILLLSHDKPMSVSDTNPISSGSQFTHFLTAPLQAFCHLVGLSPDIEADLYSGAENLLSSALAEWEVSLCTSNSLDQVWAQVLTDPFLRRLIIRFVFCRAALSLFHSSRDNVVHLPECLPNLPESVSPESAIAQIHIHHLAERLGVLNYFHFIDSINR
ncbi:protein SCAI-like isoform X1 [Zingiber officinale]|uniref:protein SCAI-like isoform X1 n=1 Tax=Zingiber officinale TaxID=94328 RepID=UPI001C4C671F|nr:protein SCAI-like isoform X1 [Zingiber officinale]